ncbi:MAG: hypothetical protein JO002_17410, partial [Burkholderiaceae bacterium]|nr:hypothetical protein [Burkholderiaceae bacterium]
TAGQDGAAAYLTAGSYQLVVTGGSTSGAFDVQASAFSAAAALNDSAPTTVAALAQGASVLYSMDATPGDTFAGTLSDADGAPNGEEFSVRAYDAYGKLLYSGSSSSIQFSQSQASGPVYVVVTQTAAQSTGTSLTLSRTPAAAPAAAPVTPISLNQQVSDSGIPVPTVIFGTAEVATSSTSVASVNSADTQYLKCDINGDGKTDLLEIVHAADGTAVATEWMAGTGGYTQGASTVLGQWVAGTQYLVAQMASGAGNTLVAIQNASGQAVATRWSLGAAGLTQMDQTTLGTWSTDTYYVYGDVIGNGTADVLALNYQPGINNGYGSVQRWIGGSGGFAQGASNSIWGNGVPTAPLQYWLQDVNGNGKQNLVLTLTDTNGQGDNLLTVSVNADGSISASTNDWYGGSIVQPLPLRSANGATSSGLIYQNADGTVHIRTVASNGAGGFRGVVNDTSLGAAHANEVLLTGDMNGDGNDDLVQIWENAQDQTVVTTWYANATGAGFAKGQDVVLGNWLPGITYHLADSDSSGYADIVATMTDASGNSVVAVWHNTAGNSSFGTAQTSALGTAIALANSADTQTLVTDINGDGKEDLLQIVHAADGTAIATEWMASAQGYTQGASTVLGQWIAGSHYLIDQMASGFGNTLVAVQDVNGNAVATRWSVGSGGLVQIDQSTLDAWSDNTQYEYGDVTGTGVADLLEVAASTANSLTVTRWSAGSAGFTSASTVSTGTNYVEQPLQLQFQNLSGNGQLTLLVDQSVGTSVSSYQVVANSAGTLSFNNVGISSQWLPVGSNSVDATLRMNGGADVGFVSDNGDGTTNFQVVDANGTVHANLSLGASQLNQQFYAGDLTGNGNTDLV